MTRQWQCTVCGYIHEGPEPPEHCPVCGADRSKFVLLPEQETPPPEPATRFHLHPILSHFPNALMPTAWLFLVVHWLSSRPALEEGAVWLVGVVTLVTPLSLITGIYDWRTRFAGLNAPIFTRKIVLSVLLLLLGWAALLLRPTGGEGAGFLFLACLAGMLVCVTLLGYYGGKLVFSTPPRH